MGEYASYNGESVKIGTCESMYYLRADQAHLVTPESGNVDPIRDAAGIRFRFPFPDEDGVQPGGDFKRFDRGINVYPDESYAPTFGHYTIQFSSPEGYLVSLPCPEDPKSPQTLKIHRNGFIGKTHIKMQRVWNGHLALVMGCACGGLYRLEELADAEPIILACRSKADELTRKATIDPRRPSDTAPEKWDSTITFWHTIADRIVEGYTNPPAWVRGEVVSRG